MWSSPAGSNVYVPLEERTASRTGRARLFLSSTPNASRNTSAHVWRPTT